MNAAGYILNIRLPAADAGAGLEFIALQAAVRNAGHLVRQEWLRLAGGVLVNRHTGDYINGLRAASSFQYPYDGDSLAVGVFNTAKHARVVEEGHPGFDLSQRIKWGKTPKSRLGKKGWYIRIPFRHYTPPRPGAGATAHALKHGMTPAIYAVAQRLRKGERLTLDMGRMAHSRRRVTSKGAQVGVRGIGPGRPHGHPFGYHPGGHYLSPTSAQARRDMTHSRAIPVGNGGTVHQHPGQAKTAASMTTAVNHGATPDPMRKEQSIYEGMFRSGAKGHSQYLTVRTITARTPWWIPAQAGKHIARQVQDRVEPIVRAQLQEAFAADVERSLLRALGGA